MKAKKRRAALTLSMPPDIAEEYDTLAKRPEKQQECPFQRNVSGVLRNSI